MIVVAEKVSWSGVSCQQRPFEEGALHSTHQTQVLPDGCGVPLNKVGGRVLVHLLVFVNCRLFSHLLPVISQTLFELVENNALLNKLRLMLVDVPGLFFRGFISI